MKSKVTEDRFIIECACGSPDHLLIIEMFEDEYSYGMVPSDISFYFTSDWRIPFFRRIKCALEFIFFKKSFYTSNSVHINEQNIEDLKEMILKWETFLKIEK